jgi:hypothetical protein
MEPNMSHRGLRVPATGALVCGVALICLAANSARAVDIDGVQPDALSQPQINAAFSLSPGASPLMQPDPINGGTTYNATTYLDTGTSGVLLSQETAGVLRDSSNKGITPSTFNGSTVVYTDVGIGGGTAFNVSQPIYASLAPFVSAYDNPPLANYMQSYGPWRIEIATTPADDLIGPVDIIGMPAMIGKVTVMDTGVVNSGQDDVHTFIYKPGTAFNPDPNARDTNPGIPNTQYHVKLSYGSFDRFTGVTPAGAPGPVLSHNPFIGPNPVASLDPNPVKDTTPPVTIGQLGKTTTGSFLFDTGATSSFISTALAGKVGVGYKAGTQGTDNPQLINIQTGQPIPNQFSEQIGGVGTPATVAGFYLDSLSLPTVEGEPIRFLHAPVLVTDVTVQDPNTQQMLTLDGDFGMNFLVASLNLANGGPDAGSQGAFDWATFDEPNGLLGLTLVAPEPATLALLLVAWPFLLRRQRRVG